MTDPVSAYRFAASPAHARRTMAWYAAMFAVGPVLDIGTGRGYFLEALRSCAIEGVGVDIREESAAEARQLGVTVIVEDAFEFLADQRGFGGVFLSHLIEHLDPDRAQDLLRAAYDALMPGGVIVIVTPNPRDWMVLSDIFWLDPTHVRPYPRQLVGAMLEAAGFVIEASGLRPTSQGRRQIPLTILKRIWLGSEYGRGEAWVRARRT